MRLCKRSIVFRRNLESMNEAERLLIHRCIVKHHSFAESAHSFVRRFRYGLLGAFYVELPRRVGEVGDLCIGELSRALSEGRTA